ncbi:hypothetical protein GCM10026988_37350 [Vibrio panuliri]
MFVFIVMFAEYVFRKNVNVKFRANALKIKNTPNGVFKIKFLFWLNYQNKKLEKW